MSYRDVVRILGYNFLLFSLLILIPLAVAVYYQFMIPPESHPQPHSTLAFLETFSICFLLGATCWIFGLKASKTLYKKEAIAAVVLIWFITPAIAALPFLLSHTVSNPILAYFEATSGLTTTGSTIFEGKKYNPVTHEEIPIVRTVQDQFKTTYTFYGTVVPVRDPLSNEVIYEGVEAVGKALLFWRSFIQWIGGLGIIVLFITVLPSLGITGKFLFQAEVTGPLKDALVPRVAQAALQLWMIYLSLTMIEMILLTLTNSKMEWLDVVTVSLSTLPGGGFSIRNASIGYYNNPATEWIVAIFMALGSTNFTVYYYAVRGKFYRIFKPELYLYLTILLCTCTLAAWLLVGKEKILLTGDGTTPSGVFSIEESIRYGFFQMISSLTSTGFATANYDLWPYATQSLMIILMFVGGMSGSTAGGIKIIRHYIFFNVAKFRLESLFRTEPVRQVKVAGQEIDSVTTTMVLSTMFIWVAASILVTFLFILNGVDLETSIGLVACMANNVGCSFRAAGPTVSCAFLSDFGLVLSSLLMIMGRLEFFAVLVFFVPAFWRSN